MEKRRIVISVRSDRVATVFDFADRVVLVELEAIGEACRTERALRAGPPAVRAAALAEFGAGVLICGAISRPLAQLVTAYGIEIVPFVRGRVDEVMDAYLAGRLGEPSFRLPGFRRP